MGKMLYFKDFFYKFSNRSEISQTWYRELVAMTLCIRDEVIEYVMGYMFEDITTMNNNYERGK